MIHTNLDEARVHLRALLDAALRGEQVFIASEDTEGTQIVQLVAVKRHARRPRFGSARGLISVADDFDAPLDDFAEYR